MLHNNRITRALCAVILAGSLLFHAGLTHPVSAVEGVRSDVDVYAMDIEFGSLSFYYDYGNWNVNTMRYEADKNSADPAMGTTSGFPGWYGFDGTSNKITVTNGSVNGKNITVSMTYRSLTNEEYASAGAPGVVSGVTMSVEGWTARAGDYTADVPAQDEVVAYIHLSGEPQMGGSAYESAILQPVGMLTIKIESP